VHLEGLVKEIKKARIPVSVSCQPLNKENIQRLAKAGVGRLGIALDAATEALFEEVKGVWWSVQLEKSVTSTE
jgi:biotin synthase-related radical SAM superfamily protein